MKTRTNIGIDISTNEVRGACIRTGGGGPQLTGIIALPTPQDAMDSEGLLIPSVIGGIIRQIITELDPKCNAVHLGINNCSMVARVMEIPPVPDQEIRPVLRGELDHYRILPVGQSAFDYCTLPDLPDKEDDPKTEQTKRVLLIGAEERLVTSYMDAAFEANVNLKSLEPGSIAVLRALYPQLKEMEAVAMVILSASGTDVFIVHQGNLQFYRRVDTGTTELMNQSSQVPEEEERKRPRLTSLLSQIDDPEEDESEQTSIAERFNRQAISLLMTEVQRSIDYYLREFPPNSEKLLVQCVIDSPNSNDLFEIMQQYLRSDAELASTQGTLAISQNVPEFITKSSGGAYLIAIGLALKDSGAPYSQAPALNLRIGDRIITEQKIAPRLMMLSYAFSGAILLGAIITSIYFGIKISEANQTLILQKNELQAITAQHAAKVAYLNRQNTLVTAIHEKDKPIRETIDFLSACIGNNASLNNLSVSNAGDIDINGVAPTPQVIADIMDTINLSPVLEPIRLNNIARVTASNEKGVLNFDLQTSYVKDSNGDLLLTSYPAQGGQSQ